MAVALIMGADNGIGAAIAKKFAQEGLTLCLVRRQAEKLAPLVADIEAAGGTAFPFSCDASQEDQVAALIKQIETNIGAIEVLVFNLGSFQRGGILEESPAGFMRAWQECCLAAFICAQQLTPYLLKRGSGSLLFTGASASLRGGAHFPAFATAKGGLRQLAQSLARELGPQEIHVAHVVLDGLADVPATKERFPQAHQDRQAQDALLKPEQIAEAYWFLHQQAKNTWTFELDLRPYAEAW